MKTVLALFVLAGFCLSATLAIRCYECQVNEPGCNDDFVPNDKYIIEGCTACMKSKAPSSNIVARSCTSIQDDACHNIEVHGIETETCTCTTDLCNHGNTVEMHMTKAVGMVFLAWMVKYLYR
ncbi:hypothetical protein ACF0H5_008651 [Mactra antiquata]